MCGVLVERRGEIDGEGAGRAVGGRSHEQQLQGPVHDGALGGGDARRFGQLLDA